MKRFILFAALLATALPSFALVVFDPTNLVQTTTTALQAVKTEYYQIKQRLRELDMLSHMDTTLMSALPEEAKRLVELGKTVNDLTLLLEKEGDINKTFQAIYGASNAASPEQFAEVLKKRILSGDQSVKTLIDGSKQISKAIESSSEQHNTIAKSLTTVSGVTEAAQLTASSVGVVIQQMQTLNGATAMMMTNTAAKDAKANKAEQAADQARLDYMKSTQTLLEKAQSRSAAPAP